MALDGTATGLKATIAEWLDDTTLTASIPDFIAMAEARMNRLLRVSDQEAIGTLTVTGEYLSLPADFGGLRSIYLDGSPKVPLEQMESSALRQRYQYVTGATPAAYAISAGQLQLAPIATSGTINIVYWKRIPPLASNSTNWLLTSHPDAYLYGSLLAAEMRGWNDGRLPLIKSGWDEVISEIEADSEKRRWGSSPLAPRIETV